MSLVCPLQDVNAGMYIAVAPTVEFESRNVYRWSARCGMRVHECISLVCLL